MKIALAQTNSWLGDFSFNRQKILAALTQAQSENCDLVVFPEATLFGYHPCDLLERPSVVEAQLKELKLLQKQIPKGLAVLVGAIGNNQAKDGKPFLNAAVFLEKGKKPQWFAKQLLPTYDVFDESRHIEPGKLKNNILKWRGQKILITICEDIWAWPSPGGSRSASYLKNPLKEVKRPIDLVINLSASPFAESKMTHRMRVVKATAAHFAAPMLYVNMVGAQDELIFDGASFAITPQGRPLVQCERFKEDFKTVEIEFTGRSKKAKKQSDKSKILELPKDLMEIRRLAIVLGMQDFARKNGFSKFHFGLSGGIDSAVVACLAVDAVGPKNVTAVALPGPFSAPESLSLAEELAKNLNIEFKQVPIDPLYQDAVVTLQKYLGETSFGVMQENLQSRLRAMILMAIANRQPSLLLTTSNKSELATGYSTLYGDMGGALMPIGDLLKCEVYELAEYYNRVKKIIPEKIISRPPTAELRPNQRDQDSLPAYSVLDPIVHKLVDGYKPAQGMIENNILQLMMRSEFKRWQAPPILKLSDHAFGRGRRFPLGHKAYF